MADVDFDAIGADVVATVAAVAGVKSCVYPPPEVAPAQGPSCWVDLGPIPFDLGNLEIGQVGITVTVATPRKGDYPREYRLVLKTAYAIVVAFRANVLIAGQAVVAAPAVVTKPVPALYGEQQPNNVTACTVQFAAETLTETVNQIAP